MIYLKERGIAPPLVFNQPPLTTVLDCSCGKETIENHSNLDMAANVANTEDISHFSNQDDTEEKGEDEESKRGKENKNMTI